MNNNSFYCVGWLIRTTDVIHKIKR